MHDVKNKSELKITEKIYMPCTLIEYDWPYHVSVVHYIKSKQRGLWQIMSREKAPLSKK